jgi:hypothetical protein
MRPTDICKQVLGADKLRAVLDELSAPQIKAVLKEGGVKVKLPGGYTSQKKRRALWTDKVCASVEQGNEEAGGELLQQWLLHHRRQMLIDLLDRLEVKHRQGETDESFLVSGSTEKIRDGATWLFEKHDRVEAVAYLRYIAYQQRSPVFDGWDRMEVAADGTADAGAADAGTDQDAPPQ